MFYPFRHLVSERVQVLAAGEAAKEPCPKSSIYMHIFIYRESASAKIEYMNACLYVHMHACMQVNTWKAQEVDELSPLYMYMYIYMYI